MKRIALAIVQRCSFRSTSQQKRAVTSYTTKNVAARAVDDIPSLSNECGLFEELQKRSRAGPPISQRFCAPCPQQRRPLKRATSLQLTYRSIHANVEGSKGTQRELKRDPLCRFNPWCL
jgi:hypothetical protein